MRANVSPWCSDTRRISHSKPWDKFFPSGVSFTLWLANVQPGCPQGLARPSCQSKQFLNNVESKQLLGEGFEEAAAGHRGNGVSAEPETAHPSSSAFLAGFSGGTTGCPWAVHPLIVWTLGVPGFSQVHQPVCLWDAMMWVRPEMLWSSVLETKQNQCQSFWEWWISRGKTNQTTFSPMWKQAQCT